MSHLRKKGMTTTSTPMMTTNRLYVHMCLRAYANDESAPFIFSMKNKKECPFSSMRDCCIYSASPLSY